MITDAEIKIKGFNALTNALGEVEAERFVSLIMREPFDYTKWQRELWNEKTIEEISSSAMKFRKENEKMGTENKGIIQR
jgi:hypothetical protein